MSTITELYVRNKLVAREVTNLSDVRSKKKRADLERQVALYLGGIRTMSLFKADDKLDLMNDVLEQLKETNDKLMEIFMQHRRNSQ